MRVRLSRPVAHESLPPVHPAPGGDDVANARRAAFGHRCLPAAAAVGAARSGLPDHPGRDAVSRCKSRRHDVLSDGTARATVRPDARLEPDVIDQFRRVIGDYLAVQPGAIARYRRNRKFRPRSTLRATCCPTDLPQPPIYNKVNPADAPIIALAITSKTIPLTQLEDLVDTRLAQKLSQLSGVGLVTISGGQKPAVRIQVNPKALANLGVGLEDVRTAITNANTNGAKGSFDGPLRASTIDANDQLKSAAEYKQVIVAYKNGAPVRMQDIADVVDGAENSRLAAWSDSEPAIVVNIQRQPGANVIAVVDSVKALLPQLKTNLPGALDVEIQTDRTVTIRASVKDVEFELLLSIALVVMVIFVFLRSVPATIIPSVAVPLSLVGTFGVMYLAGFSINNLTLMALTIATGFVVDDAIVMIENISRYIEEGDKPLEAALKGAEQIGFTIISLTISLIAVLIPLLFMGDVVGRLFREFAVTLAVAILISAVVSLTLTPMMSARLLKHTDPEHENRFLRKTGAMFDAVIARYGKMLTWVLDRQILTLLVATATVALTVILYVIVPKGFFPVQDTGRDPGDYRGTRDHFVCSDGAAPAGTCEGSACRSGGAEPVFLHRRGRHQCDPKQRPHADQFEAAWRSGAPPPR